MYLEDINIKDSSGRSKIHYAQSVENLKELIEAGADVNARDNFRCTPLHVFRSNKDFVLLLIEAGADINAIDHHGNTVLHYTNNKDVIKILVSKGADINVKNVFGQTPLHTDKWPRYYYIEAIKTLIELGADVFAKDNKGRYPQDPLAEEKREEIKRKDEKDSLMKIFLNKSSNKNLNHRF